MSCYPIYQIDAFCQDLFTGNPAAVCILDDWLPDSLLEAIAAENNLSETAFLVQEQDKYRIRWFTPNKEVELCGHATLAAAYVVFEHLGWEHQHCEFLSLSGPLGVAKTTDAYTLDFPKLDYSPILDTSLIAGALGFDNLEAYSSQFDALVILSDPDQVQKAKPNLTLVQKLPYRGLILSAHIEGNQIYSRCFYPKYGVNEDPMTGSAHAVILPFWQDRLGLGEIQATQGFKRQGFLTAEVKAHRVLMRGKCKLFLKGQLFLEGRA